jgi:hypothetical protein
MTIARSCPAATSCLGEDLGGRECRVLGCPAADDRDRLAALDRRPDGGGEIGRGTGSRERGHQPTRHRRFGGDHVGHVIRRTVAQARHVGRGPRVRCAGQWGGRIERRLGGHRRLLGREGEDRLAFDRPGRKAHDTRRPAPTLRLEPTRVTMTMGNGEM